MKRYAVHRAGDACSITVIDFGPCEEKRSTSRLRWSAATAQPPIDILARWHVEVINP
jgi:hypothetical protein